MEEEQITQYQGPELTGEKKEKKSAGFVDIIQTLEKLGFRVIEIKKNYGHSPHAIDIKIKKK